jgi:hypothetical protein
MFEGRLCNSDVYVKFVSVSTPFTHTRTPEKNRLIHIILQCESCPFLLFFIEKRRNYRSYLFLHWLHKKVVPAYKSSSSYGRIKNKQVTVLLSNQMTRR